MGKATVAAGTLTADVVINVMIQERRYARNGVMPGAFVPPTSLDMDGDYATGALDTAFVATAAPGASYAPFDNVGGGQPGTVTLACKNTGKYNGGNVNNAAARMRDHFPDCFLVTKSTANGHGTPKTFSKTSMPPLILLSGSSGLCSSNCYLYSSFDFLCIFCQNLGEKKSTRN